MLLDDEIYTILNKFESNVRILIVSDSCHSGSVFRVADAELFRSLPTTVSNEIIRKNISFYKEAKNNSDENHNSNANVILLSACQDDQKASDGKDIDNGLFTSNLLKVWNDGDYQGNYDDFINDICEKMPNISIQTPSINFLGPDYHTFRKEKPFTILV